MISRSARKSFFPLTFRTLSIAALVTACCAGLSPAQSSPTPAGSVPSWEPKIHFTAPPHWFNDPNGPILLDGQYHLFFQLNPFGDQWGHMSWGHAVSTDLVRWKQLPVAVPEADGVAIFSGSTVEDKDNTSGLCADAGQRPTGCMVAIYTGASETKQTQNLAYSRDGGTTWAKFSGNPVIDLNLKDFRDPKVFWYAPTHSWIMVVALPDQHKVRFYRSKNLREWQLSGEFGPAGAVSGVWECPDLFELPIRDAKSVRVGSRWLLNVNINPGGIQGGSADQYFVGQFDGSHFTEDHPGTGPHWTDFGKDFYAATSFSNTPPDQDRLMIAWMSNWQYAGKLPSLPGRGEMTIVRNLFFREPSTHPAPTPGQEPLQLVQRPVLPVPALKPYAALIGAPAFQTVDQANARLAAGKPPGNVYLLRLNFDPGEASEAGIRLRRSSASPNQAALEETVVGINTSTNRIFVDRTHSGKTDWSPDFPSRVSAPLKHPQANSISIQIVVDENSVEVFAEDGETVLTSLIYPSPGSDGLSFYSTPTPPGSAPARIRNVQLFRLDQ